MIRLLLKNITTGRETWFGHCHYNDVPEKETIISWKPPWYSGKVDMSIVDWITVSHNHNSTKKSKDNRINSTIVGMLDAMDIPKTWKLQLLNNQEMIPKKDLGLIKTVNTNVNIENYPQLNELLDNQGLTRMRNTEYDEAYRGEYDAETADWPKLEAKVLKAFPDAIVALDYGEQDDEQDVEYSWAYETLSIEIW